MKRTLFPVLALVPALCAAQGFDCLIEPSEVVEVRAPTDGVISAITVQRGDLVKRGQVLVRLESTADEAVVALARHRARMDGQIASARTRIDYASKKLARMNDLVKDNFTSALARDEADAERRLAEAELQSALETQELARLDLKRSEAQLALRTMTAPFSGVVVDRMLNPGDLAESGAGRKPVLKIARIDPMRVDVALPAALFGRVQVGRPARVTPAIGAQAFPGTVRGVDRVIDAASGTFVARLEVANPKGAVPGGARCQASIDGLEAPLRPARQRNLSD